MCQYNITSPVPRISDENSALQIVSDIMQWQIVLFVMQVFVIKIISLVCYRLYEFCISTALILLPGQTVIRISSAKFAKRFVLHDWVCQSMFPNSPLLPQIPPVEVSPWLWMHEIYNIYCCTFSLHFTYTTFQLCMTFIQKQLSEFSTFWCICLILFVVFYVPPKAQIAHMHLQAKRPISNQLWVKYCMLFSSN